MEKIINRPINRRGVYSACKPKENEKENTKQQRIAVHLIGLMDLASDSSKNSYSAIKIPASTKHI